MEGQAGSVIRAPDATGGSYQRGAGLSRAGQDRPATAHLSINRETRW